MTQPVLSVQGLVKHFPVARRRGGGTVHAVEGVDLTIHPGQMVGLVGESGSGKSTVGKCIVRLLEPTAGTITLLGQDITHLPERSLRRVRDDVNMVFQDPFSSLEPRMTIGQIVAEPLRAQGKIRGRRRDERIAEMLQRVGLAPDMRYRYPHELSGGQRQRAGIARALICEPRLLIADEPVSSLDVSVQASIINLLLDLQRDLGFSCLFIAHDLATVQFLCDFVAVMYLGRIVEFGSREQLFSQPRHPYTQSLLSAVVVPDPVLQRTRSRVVLPGDIPSPLDPPSGCAFHTRCPVAQLPWCADERPALADTTSDGHLAACHLIRADGTAPSIVTGASNVHH
jgi:oligopeptide/dipeptide ABC transporter ATP-binding protein